MYKSLLIIIQFIWQCILLKITILKMFSVHKWRRHRRLITPVFNANLLDQFFPVFNEKNRILTRNLKKELGKTKPFDLWDYIADTTLDIICRKFFNN